MLRRVSSVGTVAAAGWTGWTRPGMVLSSLLKVYTQFSAIFSSFGIGMDLSSLLIVYTQFPAIFSSFGIGMVLSSLLRVYTQFPAILFSFGMQQE